LAQRTTHDKAILSAPKTCSSTQPFDGPRFGLSCLGRLVFILHMLHIYPSVYHDCKFISLP